MDMLPVQSVVLRFGRASVLAVVVLAFVPGGAGAQNSPGNTVTSTKVAYKIAFASPASDAETTEAAKVAAFDMSLAGGFAVLDPATFPSNYQAEGMNVDAQRWK